MFAQDLVAKNEALRRLAHELQMKAEQQLKQKDSDAHGREQQMMKSYEDSLAAARQQNAVAMVRSSMCRANCCAQMYLHCYKVQVAVLVTNMIPVLNNHGFAKVYCFPASDFTAIKDMPEHTTHRSLKSIFNQPCASVLQCAVC